MSMPDPRWNRALYADGELEPSALARLEAELAKDPLAAAEVERWQALRRCCKRVFSSPPVPLGLVDQVRAGLLDDVAADGADSSAGLGAAHSAPTRPRTRLWRSYRLGLSGLAAAAVVVLAFLWYPGGAAATPVAIEASSFAQVHEHCAMHQLHDGMDVQHASGNPLEYVRQKCHVSLRVPDLTDCGDFKVVAACRCFPVEGVRPVHVVFRCSKSNRLISVFATERQVTLVSNGRRCQGCKKTSRQYATGECAGVQLVGWNQDKHGYVLAAQADPNDLERLADSARLACLRRAAEECAKVVVAQSGR